MLTDTILAVLFIGLLESTSSSRDVIDSLEVNDHDRGKGGVMRNMIVAGDCVDVREARNVDIGVKWA